MFAWEAYERGSEVHLQADPTKLEVLHNSFKVKKEDFKEKQRDGILEKVRMSADSLEQQLFMSPRAQQNDSFKKSTHFH